MTDSAPVPPILVLGGTSEARELATALHADGLPVVSSLAGRTSAPQLPPGQVRVGGFGGAEGLARWLRDHGVAVVVDATHPFADQITEAAVVACAAASVPLLRLDRPGWRKQPGDVWRPVPDLHAAARLVEGWSPRRVFLSVGRQGTGAFTAVDSAWFLVRCIEPPALPLPPHSLVVLDRGPFTLFGELALLRRYLVDMMVTRDSGGAMTASKLEAARQLGIPVVIVQRPPRPDVETVLSVEEAAHWVRAVVDARASRSR